MAVVNLFELAVLDSKPSEFLSYQLTLRQAADSGLLSARLAAWVALIEAQGELRFYGPDRGAAAFQRALALASQTHVNEVVIRADLALSKLQSGSLVNDEPTSFAPSLSPSLEHVVHVVRRLGRRVGAGQP